MLKPQVRDRGSVTVESVAAMVFLLFLVLGTIEIAFFLYARNVVKASAHEGARAALEIGRTPEEASMLAERTIRRAVGGIVRDIDVRTDSRSFNGSSFVTVSVEARVDGFGPIPWPARVGTVAHVSRAE